MKEEPIERLIMKNRSRSGILQKNSREENAVQESGRIKESKRRQKKERYL